MYVIWVKENYKIIDKNKGLLCMRKDRHWMNN